MSDCRYVYATAGSRAPALVDRKAPGETIRLEHDLSRDLDCAGGGVTILESLWAVHADDADGDLVLAAPTVEGLVTNVRVSGGVDEASYRLVNTVTTDDGQRIERTTRVPVRETAAA